MNYHDTDAKLATGAERENILDTLLEGSLLEMDPTHQPRASTPRSLFQQDNRAPLWTEATTVEELDVIIAALTQIRNHLKSKL